MEKEDCPAIAEVVKDFETPAGIVY